MLTKKGAKGPLFLTMKEKAFTLIELLITIVIVGIIVAIALPMYTKYVATSRQQDAKAQLTAIRQAQEIYKLQYHSYTSSTALLSGWKATFGRYAFDIVSASDSAFKARATGNVDGDTTQDVWTIDQDGNLLNTTNDADN